MKCCRQQARLPQAVGARAERCLLVQERQTQETSCTADALALLLPLSAHLLLPCHAAAALLLSGTLLDFAQARRLAVCQMQHWLL